MISLYLVKGLQWINNNNNITINNFIFYFIVIESVSPLLLARYKSQLLILITRTWLEGQKTALAVACWNYRFEYNIKAARFFKSNIYTYFVTPQATVNAVIKIYQYFFQSFEPLRIKAGRSIASVSDGTEAEAIRQAQGLSGQCQVARSEKTNLKT